MRKIYLIRSESFDGWKCKDRDDAPILMHFGGEFPVDQGPVVTTEAMNNFRAVAELHGVVLILEEEDTKGEDCGT